MMSTDSLSSTLPPQDANPAAHGGKNAKEIQHKQGRSGRRYRSSIEVAIKHLVVSAQALLDSLGKWGEGELSKTDITHIYVWMGNNFHTAVAALQMTGICMECVHSAPDDLRIILDQMLVEEARENAVYLYLPHIHFIIQKFVETLRAKQSEYLSDTPCTPETPSPRRLDGAVHLKRSSHVTAESLGLHRAHIRRKAYVDSRAPITDFPVGHLLRAGQDFITAQLQSASVAHEASDILSRASVGSLHVLLDRGLSLTNSSYGASNELNITNQDIITHGMSISDILEHLGRHGCLDVTSQLDRFKFSEYPVSTGGCGDVYRGALQDGRKVAIKCLRLQMDCNEISQKQLRRTAQELYVWSKCVHANVLGLVGMAQYRGQLAMISPWVQYGNLRCLLSKEPGIDRYKLCAQIIDGIMYLHAAGVVHGDLKGDNILFTEDFTPKLTDFGNATLKEYTLRFSQTTTKAGMSLNWVAPEVLKEETGVTLEADIWSLGMTMLEVVTGRPPYFGLREVNVMRRIEGNIHPDRPEDIIPLQIGHADLLWSLFKMCWTCDPLRRPSAVQVRNEMNDVILARADWGVS